MRINNVTNFREIARPTDSIPRSKTSSVPWGRFDGFQPSTMATDFNLAHRAVVATPDIRADKVNDITNRINSGDFNVSAADVADKILSRQI